MVASPGSQVASLIWYWNLGGLGFLTDFSSPLYLPQAPKLPSSGLHQRCRDWSPRDSPNVVSTFPAAGDSAWTFPRPAWHVVRKGRAQVRLGGLPSADKSPKRGVGRGRDRRKSEKLEPRRGKPGKSVRKPGGAHGGKAARGLRGRELTFCSHPGREWGLRGPKGRAPAPDT